jgi:protein-S-isoprenylcysteine O-methyltransferase Ste14
MPVKRNYDILIFLKGLIFLTSVTNKIRIGKIFLKHQHKIFTLYVKYQQCLSEGVQIMIYIYTGCLAFMFFCIFDLNKIKFRKKSINLSFAAGIVLLAAATLGILLKESSGFDVSLLNKLFFGALSITSLSMMLFSLFAALPCSETYMELKQENNVVDQGIYALCRHPGVIWFFFFYLFLWLASGKTMMLWAGIIWTTMDIIYVYIEDRWFFPAAINGYDKYKNEVPFIIPTPASIKRCLTLNRGILR